MSRRPVVSVIIPAFNASSSLHDTIASALDQTLTHIEVIVVDDGSTDDTADLVREISETDARLRLIQQRNRGVAAARNRGIRASRGIFIAPLDSDDIWAPNKLAEQVARMRAGGERVGMVYSWWAGISADGNATGVAQTWAVEGDVYGVLLFANFIGNASVPLFRRSVLDEIGVYDESFRTREGEGCEDWDLSLRIAERYDVGLVPAYHTAYRDSRKSMSKNCDRMARSFEFVWESARLRSSDIPSRLYRWSRGTFWLYLASQAFDVRQFADARRWLLKAALADPVSAVGRWYWRRLWNSLTSPKEGPAAGTDDTYRQLSLAALGAPERLEPMPDAWWKIYAQVRRRRAEWAEGWSRERQHEVVPRRAPRRRAPSAAWKGA